MSIAALIVLAIGMAWCVGALWFFPAVPAPFSQILAAGFVVGIVYVIWKVPMPSKLVILVSAFVFVRLLWEVNRPSHGREWSPDQEHMPSVAFEGDRVTIERFRNATYRSGADYDVAWETRSYQLDKIRSVDFIVEPFSEWRALAHTFLTFGFDDGHHVAISIEIRKEKGETYSPVAGLFRTYETFYVVGDERDLIGVRANIREDPVHLFPIRATREQVRALFVSMLERANHLREDPEFYNSLTNTCTTGILDHINLLRENKIRHGLRTVLPGYSDEIAWELGLIDAEGDLEVLRERYRINDRSALGDHGSREWSRKIRLLEE